MILEILKVTFTGENLNGKLHFLCGAARFCNPFNVFENIGKPFVFFQEV